MSDIKPKMNFDALVAAIQQVDDHLTAQAGKAVNISLTLRNWLIGAYIAEYELSGQDRAKYGENLLSKLADQLENLVSVHGVSKHRVPVGASVFLNIFWDE